MNDPDEVTRKSSLFLSMVGHVYDFYGVDNNIFCIGIDGKVCAFEALEDESDGYRSYLDSVIVSMKDHIFFHVPVAQVRLEERQYSHLYEHKLSDRDLPTYEIMFEGWHLIDITDGHIWLVVGTDNSDDYYPSFIFNYRPKPPIITPGV